MVYLFEERCIDSKNKVYRFVELIHFYIISGIILCVMLNFIPVLVYYS